jgi:hypothetical protein
MRTSRRRTVLTVAAAVVILVVGALLIWVRRNGSVFGPREKPGAPQTLGHAVEPLPPGPKGLALPKKPGSLRFAVLGDVGRGDRAQYDTANELAHWRDVFDYRFVLLLGDNIYSSGTPENYAARFERPYKALLDGGVVFYAARGNHDPPDQEDYKPYNMNGNRYYSFTKEEGVLPIAPTRVRFFALDTVNLDQEQLRWLRDELSGSTASWKICFYHHPLYTSGRYRLSSVRLRAVLEPIFRRYGVDVGLSGHEHFYERIIPRGGVQYFTSGAGGALRMHDIRPSEWMAAGFDADTHFMLFEISADTLYFQAISRTGQTIDSGSLERAADPP